MPEIRGHLRRQDLVISIIAGMPIEKLANGLAHAAMVRAMPNTPAQIGQGITVWTATPEVSELQKEQAAAILGSLGEELCTWMTKITWTWLPPSAARAGLRLPDDGSPH
jgi:pyrroline-5-carboxylate reductase